MNDREQRGLQIAAKCRIDKTGDFYLVPSQSNNSKYVVHFTDDTAHCSCPDHETRGVECKHIHAVRYTVDREQNPDGTETVTETVQVVETIQRKYTQDWPAYNAAQTSEKHYFQALLHTLCSQVDEPVRKSRLGRPPLPIADAIFSACFKVYSTVSGRRFMSDLRDAFDKELIGKLPCYNSVFNVFESEDTTPILQRLIVESAMPLKSLESHFACDSSGFSASRFDRWYDHKHGGQKIQRAWVKAHIMTGVKTNVITAVEIHGLP